MSFARVRLGVTGDQAGGRQFQWFWGPSADKKLTSYRERNVKCIAMLAVATVVGTVCQSYARQLDYPNRPITIIVPFAAGALSDTGIRAVARALNQELGQQVIVDNRTGAGGIVGTEYAVRAKPDGYTLLYGSSTIFATAKNIYKEKLTFDPLKDFTPLHGLSVASTLLVINPGRPYKTVQELVAYAKANPGKVNFGSPGSGTGQHLSAELFKSVTGISMNHIPYKQGSTEIVDLISGVLDVAFEYPAPVKAHIESGKLRAIGSMATTRLTTFPTVPTFIELGYKDLELAGWSSLVLPAGVPEEIVDRLDKAISIALRDPIVRKHYAQSDSIILDEMGPEELGKLFLTDTERYRKLIEISGATVE